MTANLYHSILISSHRISARHGGNVSAPCCALGLDAMDHGVSIANAAANMFIQIINQNADVQASEGLPDTAC